MRLRVPGGRITAAQLDRLLALSEEYGDGAVQLTSRANLQVRGLPGVQGRLLPEVVAGLRATGLVPSLRHDLVRNIVMSPQSGLVGGRTDLRPVVAALDARLQQDPALAELPGRFLFVLDDGRGDLRDLLERTCDLGLAALDRDTAQLRVGGGWTGAIPVSRAADTLIQLAGRFLQTRGGGPAAPWHVRELAVPLVIPSAPDPRLPAPCEALPAGPVPGGTHLTFPGGILTRADAAALLDGHTDLVITPWRGVLIPTTNEPHTPEAR
ncbi:nitrite reductase [Nocardioides insulae]|uniref:nitrite reductase n=1 Tax=Nocardioides insulae TaxID=394734 RepID=UPI00041F2041|nr:nitrite reductase [Nocardioides insulae]